MFRSLLAYESQNGSLTDTLGFDTFLFTGNYWVGGKSLYPQNGQKPTLQSDWLQYLKLQLEQGAQNLEAAAAEVRTALPLAAFRPKVILMIPYPWAVDWPKDESWGTVNGRALHLGVQADRVAAVHWFVETATTMWKARGFNESQLSGFYWLVEALGTVAQLEDEHLLPQVAAHIHRQPGDLSFFWCPYNHTTPPGYKNWTNWRSLGFDIATLQPGFIHNHSQFDIFRTVNNVTRALGMGVEMELPLSVHNSAIDYSWERSFDAYENASDTYRWQLSVRMWYYGNEFVKMASGKLVALNSRPNSAMVDPRPYYEKLYEWLKVSTHATREQRLKTDDHDNDDTGHSRTAGQSHAHRQHKYGPPPYQPRYYEDSTVVGQIMTMVGLGFVLFVGFLFIVSLDS